MFRLSFRIDGKRHSLAHTKCVYIYINMYCAEMLRLSFRVTTPTRTHNIRVYILGVYKYIRSIYICIYIYVYTKYICTVPNGLD